VTLANLQAFANEQVSAHGFDPAGTTSVVVHWPPQAPTAAAYQNTKYVEVLVSEPTSTFFGGILGWANLTPGARAVAGSATSTNCIVGFNHIDFENNTVINMPGCGISDGGPLTFGGGTSSITAEYVGVTGSCSGCGAVNGNLFLNAPRPADPLAYLTPPSDPGPACTAPLNVGSAMTISQQKYCGWRFTGGTLNLNPGIYYITGPITAQNPGTDVTITGSNVLIYLAPGGSLDLDSNFVTMNLSGRTAAPYEGVIFYQDRSNTNAVKFAKNNSSYTFDGALYFPNAPVDLSKNSGSFGTDCTIIVAGSLDMKNNGTMQNTCSSFGSGSPLRTTALAE
jgi:hypothetical protein